MKPIHDRSTPNPHLFRRTANARGWSRISAAGFVDERAWVNTSAFVRELRDAEEQSHRGHGGDRSRRASVKMTTLPSRVRSGQPFEDGASFRRDRDVRRDIVWREHVVSVSVPLSRRNSPLPDVSCVGFMIAIARSSKNKNGIGLDLKRRDLPRTETSPYHGPGFRPAVVANFR